MKRQSWLSIIISLGLLLSTSLIAAERTAVIGKITRIQGAIIEKPVGFSPIPLTLNAPVHAGSEIQTGNNARLEISFTDGSKMTLGEWATAKLKDYQFTNDNNPRNESQVIEILTGTFRFITGLIGKSNRYKVSVETPVATIGIRGTDIFGGPWAAGMPAGEIHYGFMSISGAIVVVNQHGYVALDEPNEGTFLPMAGHKAPTPPNTWREKAINEAYQSIGFE